MKIFIWHAEKWTGGNDVRAGPEWAVENKWVMIQESAAFLSSNRRRRKNPRIRHIVSALADRASHFLELYAFNLLSRSFPFLPSSVARRRSRSRLFYRRTQTRSDIDQLGFSVSLTLECAKRNPSPHTSRAYMKHRG